MNRVTSHFPTTHKDVRSTTSKTVVWKELNASPSQMVIAMVAIETLSGASHLPLDWSRYRIGRYVGLIEFIRDCRKPPGLAQYAGLRMSYWCRHVWRDYRPPSLFCRFSFRIVSCHDAHRLRPAASDLVIQPRDLARRSSRRCASGLLPRCRAGCLMSLVTYRPS